MTDQSPIAHVKTEKVNRCGLITLDRSEALNALTSDMIDKIDQLYIDCLPDPHIYGMVVESTSEKAFCAGADVRSMIRLLPDGVDEIRKCFQKEFQHNWTLEQFNKPNISLIDGVVMGGGVGISLYGTHRVMGKNTKFAMPEVNIGLFPDVGATYFLSRLPEGIGLYLALTGNTITASDCLYLGIASHTISAEKFPEIREAMIEAEPIDAILDKIQEDFGPSELSGLQETIGRTFTGDSLEDVFSNLEKEADDGWSKHSDWARDISESLREKCPLSLKIAFRQIKEARKFTSLKQALEMDMRIATRMVENENFKEGVQAVLIDKNGAPVWHPATYEEVSDELVETFFEKSENEPFFTDLDLNAE